MLTNKALADHEALNRENTSAFERLGYDPNTMPTRPSIEDLNKAAREIFSRVKLRPQPKPKS